MKYKISSFSQLFFTSMVALAIIKLEYIARGMERKGYMEWIEECFDVNGYHIEARYTKDNVNEIFIPLIEKIETIAHEKQRRIMIYIAAAPASGKSTLVMFLRHLAHQLGYHNIQVVGMDGFHYTNDYLKHHEYQGICLCDIKGSPESFDLEKLQSYIQTTKDKDCVWPIYDRTLHEPRFNAQCIDQDIVIVEGNYLLLDEEGWRELVKDCDYSIFIDTKEEYLSHRAIQRKAKGTKNIEEAIKFYEQSDKKNIQRVLSKRMDADVNLYLDENGVYSNII